MNIILPPNLSHPLPRTPPLLRQTPHEGRPKPILATHQTQLIHTDRHPPTHHKRPADPSMWPSSRRARFPSQRDFSPDSEAVVPAPHPRFRSQLPYRGRDILAGDFLVNHFQSLLYSSIRPAIGPGLLATGIAALRVRSSCTHINECFALRQPRAHSYSPQWAKTSA